MGPDALAGRGPPPAAPRIGIDIGGTKILAVLLVDNRVEDEVKVPTPSAGGQVVAGIREVVERLTPDGRPPWSLGVGVPGLVGPEGTLRFSPHLPGLVGLPLAGALAAAYPGTRVWAGNDATAAGWAEQTAGAGQGRPDLLMITIGTGIGGAIIAGGRLVEGAHRFAGEFGHMVIDPHGPPCPCGQRGCWERFASGSGLGRLGRERAIAGRASRIAALAGHAEAVRGEHVTTAAAEGDGEAISIMADFAWWLALGLANLANILDPGVIIVGGGLIDAGEVLLGPARLAFADLVEAREQRRVTILPAALGSRAGAIGAGLLAAGGA